EWNPAKHKLRGRVHHTGGISSKAVRSYKVYSPRYGFGEIVPSVVESGGSRRTARYATWTC
ncbi:MAG: hypothetical protein ACRECH_14340, partial [Nitrososphaerales archaeon]